MTNLMDVEFVQIINANQRDATSIVWPNHRYRRGFPEFMNGMRKVTEGDLSSKVAKGGRDDTYETLKCVPDYVDKVLGWKFGLQINANVQSNKNWSFRPKLTNKPQPRRQKHAKYDPI